MWSFQHLLMEARLCRFVSTLFYFWFPIITSLNLDSSFERGKVLSSLHFKCKFFGSLSEEAIMGVYFRKDQLDQLRPGHTNEMLSQEIAITTRPISHMYGLKEITVS
ncbi:hypothetical protein X801_03500, partial [Opisthorchis viverrini]